MTSLKISHLLISGSLFFYLEGIFELTESQLDVFQPPATACLSWTTAALHLRKEGLRNGGVQGGWGLSLIKLQRPSICKVSELWETTAVSFFLHYSLWRRSLDFCIKSRPSPPPPLPSSLPVCCGCGLSCALLTVSPSALSRLHLLNTVTDRHGWRQNKIEQRRWSY